MRQQPFSVLILPRCTAERRSFEEGVQELQELRNGRTLMGLCAQFQRRASPFREEFCRLVKLSQVGTFARARERACETSKLNRSARR
jgi:hypothetical protein